MNTSDENATERDAAKADVACEGALENYIKGHPITAVAVSIVVGALLAKFLF